MKKSIIFLVIAIAASSFAAHAQTKTPKKALQKNISVEKLIELTHPAHPYVGVEKQLANLPGTPDLKEEEERVRKVRLGFFDAALNVNKNLTPDQKSFVRANYDRLSKNIDQIIDEAVKKNFPVERWIWEGLRQSYTAKFTDKERTGLIVYFQAAAGQRVLKYVRVSQMAQMITGSGGTLDFTEADKVEHDKFAASPIGGKFITAFITDAQAYELRKENAARAANLDVHAWAIMEPANLNAFFNKFVAENYKK